MRGVEATSIIVEIRIDGKIIKKEYIRWDKVEKIEFQA